jgi:Cu/Ag efflux protein CusF
MIRMRIATLSLAVLAALALAATAGAQVRVEEKVNLTVTGEITALDAAARQITVKDAHDAELVYAVDGSATILSGANQKLALGELQKGWHVVMNGHEAGGRRLVTYVKVVKQP